MQNRKYFVVALCWVVMIWATADPFEEAKKDIIAKQAQVRALSANLTHEIRMSEPGEMEMSSTDTGSVEYLKKGDTVLFREATTTSGYLKEGKKKEDLANKTLLVFDGETLFMEQTHKRDRAAYKSKRSQNELPLHFLDAAKTLGKDAAPMTLLPEGSVGDKKVYVFETAKSPSDDADSGKLKLYFDKESGVLVKAEAFDSKGATISSRVYSEVKIGVEIDEGRFKYTPPKGVKVIDNDKPQK